MTRWSLLAVRGFTVLVCLSTGCTANPTEKPADSRQETRQGSDISVGSTTRAEIMPFSEVEIEKPFDVYLQSNRLLMEVTGAKIIRLDNGNQVVLAVGSRVLKDQSPQERLEAEKVCRINALASVVAEKAGVQIAHVEQLKEKTVIVLDNGNETGKSVSELLRITKTKVEGISRDMPVVARWKSKDGNVLYLAIGTICDKAGEPIRTD